MPIELGLVNEERWSTYLARQAALKAERERLQHTKLAPTPAVNETLANLCQGEQLKEKCSLAELLKRPTITYEALAMLDPGTRAVPQDIQASVGTELQFEGYINRQQREVNRVQEAENLALPPGIAYSGIQQLSKEAREKLARLQPLTLGQAQRLSGVSPSDVQVLHVLLRAGKLPVAQPEATQVVVKA
jgi:tRNA uridine 5-carboxymethylaminomethyl modification enzyme